jgi:exportin-2 (importin alpha re-exporter)
MLLLLLLLCCCCWLQVSNRPGQDNLAMAAIRFLTTVARSVHSKLFADPSVLKQICESIILPNLRVSGRGAAA